MDKNEDEDADMLSMKERIEIFFKNDSCFAVQIYRNHMFFHL